mmetsp:Transcript_9542/g.31635  ORF Transcript_9542/g.31635 Transcript_9542/m.31635 type:complete len:288 (-) Transcript_9542:713-1576(-)
MGGMGGVCIVQPPASAAAVDPDDILLCREARSARRSKSAIDLAWSRLSCSVQTMGMFRTPSAAEVSWAMTTARTRPNCASTMCTAPRTRPTGAKRATMFPLRSASSRRTCSRDFGSSSKPASSSLSSLIERKAPAPLRLTRSGSAAPSCAAAVPPSRSTSTTTRSLPPRHERTNSGGSRAALISSLSLRTPSRAARTSTLSGCCTDTVARRRPNRPAGSSSRSGVSHSSPTSRVPFSSSTTSTSRSSAYTTAQPPPRREGSLATSRSGTTSLRAWCVESATLNVSLV